jgi:hypothetical protein
MKNNKIEIEEELKIKLNGINLRLRSLKKEFYTVLYEKVEIMSRIKKIEVFKKIEENF